MTIQFRPGASTDAPAIHSLIAANMTAGHLLPRTLDDVAYHAERFLVAFDGDAVIGCAELAPLSGEVAEVRSLVVDESARGHRIGMQLVNNLAERARSGGFRTLCAFTHEPSHFMRLGFSIVPHVWMPEKIARDCIGCAQFRRCGQYAVSLSLQPGAILRVGEGFSHVSRAAALPKTSVQRLRPIPVMATPENEPAPA